MEQGKIPKYLQEVEEILREHCQDNEPSEWLKMTEALIEVTRKVEVPSGDAGEFVTQVLNILSEKLCPVMAAYTAFKLGIAYERYQNANKEGGLKQCQ